MYHFLIIHYKLEDINIIVDKSNIIDLKHQDYKGKRIPIIIKDNYNNELNVKVDIGIHTDFDITQNELCFDTCLDNKKISLMVNSTEQIFVEKIIPIIKFGLLSTRYKDFYDLYWLIEKGNMNKKELSKILNHKIFENRINGIDSLEKLIQQIDFILSNKNYLKVLNNRKNNWLDVNDIKLKSTIISYLNTILTVFV